MCSVLWFLPTLVAVATALWANELQLESPSADLGENLSEVGENLSSVGENLVDVGDHDWDDAAVDRKIVLAGGVQEQEDEAPGEPLSPDDFANAKKQAWGTPAHDATESAGLFEGDIRGDPERNVIRNLALRWRMGVVPYVISPRFDERERAVIAGAMAGFHELSCVRFVPRTTQRDFLRIVPDHGCSSNVGRVGHGQVVSLGDGCVFRGVVQHELIHSLGFWHEQSRADRDRYVTVLWRNIQQGMEFNFQKVSERIQQTLGVAYDVDSVTHYGRFAFSRAAGLPTLVPKRPGQEFLGQQIGLSKADVYKLNKLYECRKMDPSTPSIEPTGTCKDSDGRCARWAADGQCARAADYMATFCTRSCQSTCHGPDRPTTPARCVDGNLLCVVWSALGQCTTNPVYMLRVCRRACAVCRP